MSVALYVLCLLLGIRCFLALLVLGRAPRAGSGFPYNCLYLFAYVCLIMYVVDMLMFVVFQRRKTYIHIYIYVYIHIELISLSLSIYIYIYICMYMYVNQPSSRGSGCPRELADISRSIYIMTSYVYMCIYIYIYTCMCIYIYIYI